MTNLETLQTSSYPILVFVFSYVGIPLEKFWILGILILVDVFTALIRQAVIDPRTLSSRTGLVGTVSKMCVILIPFVVAIVGKGAGFDVSVLVSACISIIMVAEGWSIFGNIGQIISKDQSRNEYDAITLLIKKLQDVFKGVIEGMLKFGNPKDLNSNSDSLEK